MNETSLIYYIVWPREVDLVYIYSTTKATPFHAFILNHAPFLQRDHLFSVPCLNTLWKKVLR